MNPRIAADAREWVAGRATGIGRYLESVLTRALDVHPGWEWHLFLHAGDERRVEGPGVTYHEMPRRPAPWVDQVVLRRDLTRLAPDLFFSPYIKVPWRSPCPTVSTVHDLLLLTLPGGQGGLTGVSRLRFAWYARRSLRRADALIAVSEATRREIIGFFGPLDTDVRVFHESPAQVFGERDAAEGARVREKYGIRGPYLLTVGNAAPHKNLPFLLRVWSALRPTLTSGTLVMAGHQGPGAEDVLRVGRVPDEDLAPLYREAVALLQPSWSEGFGLPVAEALASGTPAVVSDRGSLPELAGSQMPVLAPDDAAGWTDVLRRLLTDPDERARLAGAAAERARAFWPEATIDPLLDHLMDLATAGAD